MDTREVYIKMCDCPEIQDGWHCPNGAHFPDYAYTYSSRVYKRKIKRHMTSHFVPFDYIKGNPDWIKMHDNRLGLVKARHWSGVFGKHNSGFSAVDETYPGGDKGLVEIHGGSRLEDEEWLPQSEPIWLPTQDRLQGMINLPLDRLWTKFINFAGDGVDCYEYLAPEYKGYSWEQLWLSFVMQEKFGKTWIGDKWALKEFMTL